MRRIVLIVLFVVLAASRFDAAGTVTVVSSAVNVSGQTSGMRAYTYSWTSDGSGNVSTNSVIVSPGAYLRQVALIPSGGAAQPDDNYDVSLKDSHGTDLLGGLGTDCDQTIALEISQLHVWVDRSAVLQLVISGAGATNGGSVVLWYGPQ